MKLPTYSTTMKSFKQTLLASIIVGAFALVGCEEKGPMEKAGASMDEAARETGEAFEEAGEELNDAVNE